MKVEESDFKESEADCRARCRCGKLILAFHSRRAVMHQYPECAWFADALNETAVPTTINLEWVEMQDGQADHQADHDRN
jgi:hypothetical protein